MSKGEILYVKGMNISESEEESEEDIWDDSKLTAAYDKAVSMANAEIAKRIAMTTNNRNKLEGNAHGTEKSNSSKTSPRPNAKTQKYQAPPSIWKAGMACRAVYECDGLEYEAFVLRIINDKECVVRFLGYENSEIVSISTLKPSLGKDVRAKQIQDALDEDLQTNNSCVENDETAIPVVNGDKHDCDSENLTAASSESHSKKNKKSKKKKRQHLRNNPEMPDLPFQMPMMPQMAQFSNLNMDFPIPPPPVTMLQSEGPSTEDQAVSSMLLSWYMSGYCTGYYQGMKRANDKRKKHHHQ